MPNDSMRRLVFVLALSLLACRERGSGDPERLITRLEDRDPQARIRAVRELHKLKARQAAPRIAALLSDPLVKPEAALFLRDLAGGAEVDALLGALETTVGDRGRAMFDALWQKRY